MSVRSTLLYGRAGGVRVRYGTRALTPTATAPTAPLALTVSEELTGASAPGAPTGLTVTSE